MFGLDDELPALGSGLLQKYVQWTDIKILALPDQEDVMCGVRGTYGEMRNEYNPSSQNKWVAEDTQEVEGSSVDSTVLF
jgi:hypothetical protein